MECNVADKPKSILIFPIFWSFKAT